MTSLSFEERPLTSCHEVRDSGPYRTLDHTGYRRIDYLHLSPSVQKKYQYVSIILILFQVLMVFGYLEMRCISYTHISMFHDQWDCWYFQGLIQSPAKP